MGMITLKPLVKVVEVATCSYAAACLDRQLLACIRVRQVRPESLDPAAKVPDLMTRLMTRIKAMMMNVKEEPLLLLCSTGGTELP